MKRSEKEQVISELKETFQSAESIVVLKQSGLSVVESTQLRTKCRELGVGFRVAKNRLAKIALVETNFEHLSDSFVGTTAVAYSEDPIAAAKAIFEFSKTNEKITIIAGGMGTNALSADDVKQWGALPGLDELRGKLVGLLQAPGGQLARVTKAYSEKSE